MGDVRLRLPTLELFAARSGGAFASSGRPLLSDEVRDARAVFGDSIQLDAVRIVDSSVAAAPTTLGNFIRIPPQASLTRRVLIHELAHVWQFQTKGTQYISDSLWHQTKAILETGDRGAAYTVTIVPGQSIHRYTAEQQAMIIEHYFARPGLRTDPEYSRMIGEVRRARPLPPSQIEEEAAFGSGDPFRWPEPDRAGRPLRVIPIFRLEF